MNQPVRMLQWHTIAIGIVLVIGLVAISWVAGQSASQLEVQRLSGQVASLQHELTSSRLTRAQSDLKIMPPQPGAAEVQNLRAQLLRAQAESNQYRSKLEAEWKADARENQLVAALSERGTKVYSLAAEDAASKASAYVVVIPHAKVILVATQLPPVAGDRAFQLWITPHGAEAPVSAGLFQADDGKIFRDWDDSTIAVDADGFAITVEPLGGSSSPTGPKLFSNEACSAK